MPRVSALLPAVLLLSALAGCSKSEEVKLVPVQGKITVAGQPLSDATIVFHPDASKGNTSKEEARATLENSSDGSYALKTKDRDGAAPGWYRVTVFAVKATSSTEPGTSPTATKYQDPNTSGLAVEVGPAAGPTVFDFDLER